MVPPGHTAANIISQDGWSPARKRTAYVTNSSHSRHFCYFHKPCTNFWAWGGAAYNIQAVQRRTSLLREGMSHMTHGEPNHQHNILIHGVKGAPEPLLQWWEGRSYRKTSLWRDNISQLRRRHNGPREDTNFIWIFENSRSFAVIKQDSGARQVNACLPKKAVSLVHVSTI
jgi:hypothetical protein